MRLKATKLKDYNPDVALLKDGKPVLQFLVVGDNPFYDLLQPSFEEEVGVKDSSLLDDLFNTYYSEVKNKTREVEDTLEIEDDLEHFEENQPKEEEVSIVLNKSVCSVGVSKSYYEENKTGLLENLKCPIFVYHDLRGWNSEALLGYLEEFSSLDSCYHALHVDCEFNVQAELIMFISKNSLKNVRLIGDKVLKLEGYSHCGLFPKKLVQHYSLEYYYNKNVHSTTQVKLVSKGLDKAPIETVQFNRATTKQKSTKQKEVKEVKKASKKQSPKPKKQKLDRRSLFSVNG